MARKMRGFGYMGDSVERVRDEWRLRGALYFGRKNILPATSLIWWAIDACRERNSGLGLIDQHLYRIA